MAAAPRMITSQIPVDRWHDVIGDPTLADAILDRIIHNAHRLKFRGELPPPQDRHHSRDLTTQPKDAKPNLTNGRAPPRPTSIGTAGRLQSEQVADFSPECPAEIVGIRTRVEGPP